MNATEIKSIVESAKAKGLCRSPGDRVPEPMKGVNVEAFDGVRFQFVLVTRDLAVRWLANNRKNRKLKQSTVEAYARDMRNGEWLTNHQGLAFNDSGDLIDGQHRLHAVATGGASALMLISTGWPTQPKGRKSRTMDTVDRGVTRSVADVLGLQHDMTNSRFVVMAANVIAILVSGEKTPGKLSVDLVLRVVEPFKAGVVHAVDKKVNTIGLRSAAMMGAIAFAYAAAPKEVTKFYEAAKSGANLTSGHPALTLRNYLLGLNANKRDGIKNDPYRLPLAVLTHLHAAIAGESLDKLMVRKEAYSFFASKQTKAVELVADAIGKGGVKR